MLAHTMIATAFMVLAFASAVHAQDRKALREACAGDARKHCATVQRGEGRIIQCLRDHSAELTPACRDGLAASGR